MSKAGWSTQLKELFQMDAPQVRMGFAMALYFEQEGDAEKANDYLDKAIAAEEKARESM